MRHKTLGIVIFYHGNTRETQANILSYIENVDKLIVWLNSDELASAAWETPQLESAREKIVFMGAGGGNVGIGRALNEAVRYGLRNGYEYLLTMDQDSHWEEVGAYLAEVSRYCDNSHDAIFTPPVDRGDGRMLPFNGKDTIQSGAVFKLSMFADTGLFNEDYFVDSTDHEFCYRAGSRGYNIIKTDAGLLRHRLGYESHIEGTKYNCENYSAQRLFYLYRAMMWIRRSYPREMINECYRNYFKNTFVCRFKWILLGEKDKAAKIAAILRGTFAGLLSKPGPAPGLSPEELS